MMKRKADMRAVLIELRDQATVLLVSASMLDLWSDARSRHKSSCVRHEKGKV